MSYQDEIDNLDDLIGLAKELHSLGPEYVLLKGDLRPLTRNLEVPDRGFDKAVVVNVLYDGIDVSIIKTAHVVIGAPQGAGCALACMSSTSETVISSNNNCP